MKIRIQPRSDLDLGEDKITGSGSNSDLFQNSDPDPTNTSESEFAPQPEDVFYLKKVLLSFRLKEKKVNPMSKNNEGRKNRYMRNFAKRKLKFNDNPRVKKCV